MLTLEHYQAVFGSGVLARLCGTPCSLVLSARRYRCCSAERRIHICPYKISRPAVNRPHGMAALDDARHCARRRVLWVSPRCRTAFQFTERSGRCCSPTFRSARHYRYARCPSAYAQLSFDLRGMLEGAQRANCLQILRGTFVLAWPSFAVGCLVFFGIMRELSASILPIPSDREVLGGSPPSSGPTAMRNRSTSGLHRRWRLSFLFRWAQIKFLNARVSASLNGRVFCVQRLPKKLLANSANSSPVDGIDLRRRRRIVTLFAPPWLRQDDRCTARLQGLETIRGLYWRRRARERSLHAGYSPPPERRHVRHVFQSYAIWPHMTVFENVVISAGGAVLLPIRGSCDERLAFPSRWRVLRERPALRFQGTVATRRDRARTWPRTESAAGRTAEHEIDAKLRLDG